MRRSTYYSISNKPYGTLSGTILRRKGMPTYKGTPGADKIAGSGGKDALAGGQGIDRY
jgi:hypothetical protein